jgi:cytochrome c553
MRIHHRMLFAAAICASALPAAAQQPPAPPPAFAPANLTESGVRSLAANCAACHGTGGKSAPESAVAALAGRAKDDIVQTMAQFKDGKRPATVMHQIAKGFSEAEIAAVAEYFSKQPR